MKLHIFVGLPASGKTTFFRAKKDTDFKDCVRLSLDDFRRQCTGVAFAPGFEPFVKSWVEVTGEYLMEHGHSIVLDATNLTKGLRRSWIERANKYGAKAIIWFFSATPTQCFKRNRLRIAGRVPDSVIEFMATRMEVPSSNEGATFWNIFGEDDFTYHPVEE